MKILLTIILLFAISNAKAQKGDYIFVGNWYSCNDNNQFKSTDTVYFYNKIEFIKTTTNCCLLTNWVFEKKVFHQMVLNICGNEIPENKSKGQLKFISEKRNDFVEIYIDTILVDKLEILEFYEDSYDENETVTKVLVLVRVKI